MSKPLQGVMNAAAAEAAHFALEAPRAEPAFRFELLGPRRRPKLMDPGPLPPVP